MVVCSNCSAEQPSSDVTSCILCGYPVKKDTDEEAVRTDDDAMDFVVTEANGDSRPFVGGQNEGRQRSEDDLGIETTTYLMQQEAQRESLDAQGDTDAINFADQPIGDSSPPPPPPPVAEYEQTQPASLPQPAEPAGRPDPVEETTGSVKKLSEEDVKQIEQNLYGSSSYLKDQDKADLVRKLDSLGQKPKAAAVAASAVREQLNEQTQPAMPTDQAKRTAPKRGTGVAYFYRNFIQLTGQYGLIPNDVITINNRDYVLRPKKVKTPYVVGGLALAFTVFLIVLASALTTGTGSGDGRLLGVVLDEYDRPYLKGATIVITEKDKKIQSDERGFFEAGMFPVGTYTLEYVVDGYLVGTEQATVTEDEVRMVFLRPGELEQASVSTEEQSSTPVTVAQVQQTSPEPAPKSVPVKETSKTASTSSSSKSSTTKSKDSYGKVTLNANIKNARFELDGSVMGAGNLTYSKIKSGRHSYRVSADGYQTAEGKLTVESGQNHKLAVTLKPLQQAQKSQTFKTDDYYYSGTTALQEGDYETAVSDLSAAIEAKPSYAEAYYSRGQAYNALKVYDKAYDDFIRSAEIYQMRKEYGNAITCYSMAVELDDRVITAYLGRGNLYLKKGEELAAIADFDKARQIDKRCYQAYYGLGEARFKQQQYKKAIDHFKDARSVNENDPLVYQYLMLSYMAIAKYKDVKKTFEKFADVATEEQMDRFRNDQKYSAVIRVIDSQ